jgi:hypothetical protein
MGSREASVRYFSLFLSTVLFALVVGTLSAQVVLAQPAAGEEPRGAPIVYNLTPKEGAVVAQGDLSRAAATIETQREASLSWAGIFVDGRRRPGDLMGPTSYLQSVSTDIGDLSPGAHTVRVVAIDSEGRAGGYAWKFTVV